MSIVFCIANKNTKFVYILLFTQQDPGPLAEQAFVFEVADTGDLEDELTGNEAGNEMLGTYSNEGMDPYSHEIYDQNGSGALSHEVSAGENQDIYSSNM